MRALIRGILLAVAVSSAFACQEKQGETVLFDSALAADIDVLQNGLWLTTLLGLDRASIKRAVVRSEEIALAD